MKPSAQPRARSVVGWLVAAVVVFAIGAGVWSFNQPKAVRDVHIGSFSVAIDYAPYLIAKSRGTLQQRLGKAGYKVEFVQFQTLPAINEALATKNADVVFEAEPPAIIGRSNGLNISIRGISSTLVQQIIVPANSPRQTLADLKGARVGVLAGTSSHFGLIKNLEAVGVRASEITIIDMTPPNAKAAFETGQIDAWAVWPPFVEQEVLAGKAKILSGGDARINSIYVMRNDFVTSDPDAAKIISLAVADTKAWMNENPNEAQEIVAKELSLPIEVVRSAWPKHDFQARITPAIVDDIQKKSDFLVAQKLIRTPVNVKADLVAN